MLKVQTEVRSTKNLLGQHGAVGARRTLPITADLSTDRMQGMCTALGFPGSMPLCIETYPVCCVHFGSSIHQKLHDVQQSSLHCQV